MEHPRSLDFSKSLQMLASCVCGSYSSDKFAKLG